MPATTPEGLPYPLASEPFADGAEAIQALAEAVPDYARSHALYNSVGSQIVANATDATVDLNTLVSKTSDWTASGPTGTILTYTGPDALFSVVGQTDFEDDTVYNGYRALSIYYDGNPLHRQFTQAVQNARTVVSVAALVPFGPSYRTQVRLRARHTAGASIAICSGDPAGSAIQVCELARL